MVGYIPVLPRTRIERLPSFIERVEQSHRLPDSDAVLQYDSRVGDLRPWLWPTKDGVRVTPDQLSAHRLTHIFRGPSCLCAYLDVTSASEAVVGLAQIVTDPDSEQAGEYLGQHVATCSEQRCGYFVVMEQFFTQPTLLVHEYPKRKQALLVADPFLFMTDDTEETARHSGLRQVLILDEKKDSALRGCRKLLKRQNPDAFQDAEDDIEQLVTEGVPAEKFWNLFVQCMECKIVMPRHYFPYDHPCATAVLRQAIQRAKSGYRELQRRLKAEDPEWEAELKRCREGGAAKRRMEEVDVTEEAGVKRRKEDEVATVELDVETIARLEAEALAASGGYDSDLGDEHYKVYFEVFGMHPVDVAAPGVKTSGGDASL